MQKVIIENQVVPVSETKTVLSFKSPSPKWASQVFNVWVTVSAIGGLALLQFANYIPDDTEALLKEVIIFGTAAMRIFTKAFGLEVKD